MALENLIMDIRLIRSTFAEGDFRWIGNEDDAALLESLLAISEEYSLPSSSPLISLEFAVALLHEPELVEAVILARTGTSESTPRYSITISGASDRKWQSNYNKVASSRLSELRNEGNPLYNTLGLLLEELSLDPPSASFTNQATNEEEKALYKDAADTQILSSVTQITRILIWSHHLLATSKRKDISEWSVELSLWTISKPGHPGIVVVEGESSSVAEFFRRIKSLNWQALNLRHEETEDVEEDESVQQKLRLGAVLKELFRVEKPRAIEVEKMADVGELMRAAGLEEMFKSGMKLK